MGIKGLFPYLVEAAPKAYNTSELKRYTGRRLAVDASAWMYQFLTIVRTGAAAENLQNNQGAATSHLQGFVLRTLETLGGGRAPDFCLRWEATRYEDGGQRCAARGEGAGS